MTKENIVLVTLELWRVWYEQAGRWLRLPGTAAFTAFVPGNHENYDACVPTAGGGAAERCGHPPIGAYAERGQVFELGGKRIFAMGGASHDIRDGILSRTTPVPKKFQRLNAQGARSG